MPLFRHLLRNEVLFAIKSNIGKGIWKDSLPSERQLTDQFQVSRGTLRYALKNLQEEGIIKAVAGSGYLITKKVRTKTPRVSRVSIGLLIGSPEVNRGSADEQWITTLQQRVAKRGWHIHIHDGIPEILRSPKIGLRKLFKATNHGCWLLIRCPLKIQTIFCEQRIPAIICGSPFEGVDLPSVDMDFRALGRHAAGLLALKGHRRIGFVCSREMESFRGDIELFEGFREGAASSSIRPEIKKIFHPNTPYQYQGLLRQVVQQQHPITALFVDCPFQFLSILNQALQAGIRLPDRLSLICRKENKFFDFLSPSPARYQFNAKEMAHKVQFLIEGKIQGDSLRNHRTLLIPDFKAGESLKPLNTVNSH